ncbi:MAG: hypothetical protein RI958_2209 [Actinomycetota bacterium]
MVTALVTGGASGIGLAIVERLSRAGMAVAVLDINGERAVSTAAQFDDAIGVHCDVSDRQSVDAAVQTTLERFGRIDLAVNNAGISGSLAETMRRSEFMERYTSELLDSMQAPTSSVDVTVATTDEDWRRMFAIHVDGTFYVTRAVLPDMLQRRSGVIVNVSSICGLNGCIGSPAYSAAKAAVIGFTKSLAREVANQGIRVNVVAPGFIDTSITPVRSTSERALAVAQIPLGRLGTPGEVAECVYFLASDASSYFTGAVVSPNGGAAMG